MDEIEQLLATAFTDVTVASDEAMRLSAEFGSDPLLMEFVSIANQYKYEIGRLLQRLQQLKQQSPSSERNAKVQFLSLEATSIGARAGRLKETVMEISRND